MALDLSTLSAAQQLAAIYIGYYDRAADPVGQDFWETAVANPNLSLADIATDFATQPETLIAYPFLESPTAEEAEGFIAEVYLNLFNRAPDAAGLEFWSTALLAAIDGTGELSVGEIILAIIGGAQDSAEGNDRTTILNKIEVSTTWTAAADAAAIDYTTDTAAQNSAKSIIEGVTDAASTVTAAKSTIDDFFEPAPVPGEEILLTSATDVETGTADDDEFNAYIQQNPFAGGVSNSLSSADRLDGGAGNDRLYAELTKEFVGVIGGGYYGGIDVQPRLKNIEEIDIEARDAAMFGGEDIVVDGKWITDHEEIGSYYSDGDLVIENLTTLTSSGTARNTSEITITMDHTDNFNTDGDASDLIVYFDNDYLLSGQESEGQIFYFLLDEDAELAGNPNRLNNIDVDGIRFTIDTGNGPVDVTLEAPEANVAGTHQGFVNALQPALQALIADGTLPAGTTLTLDPTITDVTFLDDGSQSDLIPAIVLTSGDGSPVIATGFSRIEEEIGEYDVYGRFNSINEVADQPISIDIDLHKVGRGGEGGDLIIGGKDTDTADGIADGIEVFNINVLGAGNDDPNGGMTKPSDLGTITSTGNELREVYIATDPVFAAGDTYASLTVRNGFDQSSGNVESGDLELINADAFFGDLTLGEISGSTNAGRITNADTITAQGGGDVSLGLLYDGTETAQAYSVTTAGGDDDINIELNGDALDYAGSSLNVLTGGGNDSVELDFVSPGTVDADNNQLNQAVLDNVDIDTGDGDDTIDVDNVGNANIMAGSGNDTVYTDGSPAIDSDSTSTPPAADTTTAAWALNVDAVRTGANLGTTPAEDLAGEQLSLAYIGGATVTVTLSGAGLGGDLAAGGGVMSIDPNGAVAGVDGYESTVTIGSLINGNSFYGTQADINAAVLRAINDHPVLGELLVATIAANNTVVVRSLTSGDFEDTDLRIEINQAQVTSVAAAQAVVNEARTLFQNSDLDIDDLFSTATPTTTTPGDYLAGAPAGETGDLDTSALADAWYDGLSVAGDANNSMDGAVGENLSNLYDNGGVSNAETDNVINGGSGDDVIVLSTDAVEDTNLIGSFTVDDNNALINGASNETIVLSGSSIGNDKVMNFTTAGATTDDTADDAGLDIAAGYEGVDFLDFTAYLTSEENTSTASGSASDTLITVTLATDAVDVQANEVSVLDQAGAFDNTGDAGETFAGLSASVVEQLFNNGAGYTGFNGNQTYGNLDAANFNADDEYTQTATTDQLIGAAKAILMIENADNDGEYKVFELTWNGEATNDTDTTNDGAVTAVALGSIDFGDSLVGLTEVNLIGTNDFANLIDNGFA